MDAHAMYLTKLARKHLAEAQAGQVQSRLGQNATLLSEEDRIEAEVMRIKALAKVKSNLNVIDAGLAALSQIPDDVDENKTDMSAPSSVSKLKKSSFTRISVPMPILLAGPSIPAGAHDEDAVPTSAKQLTDMADTLETMAADAGNVIEQFDEMLVKPYLEKFQATLDIVPIMAIQGRVLMYSKNMVNGDDQASTEFATFAPLPPDAPEDLSTAKIFPMQGDMYLAIGKAVWKKEHITAEDPAITGASSNWPVVYKSGWEKIGEDTLPMEVNDIAFYGTSSIGTDSVITGIVLLDKKGSLNIVSEDLRPSASDNQATPLAFSPKTPSRSDPASTPQNAPVWEKITFTRGSLYGLADGILWTVTLDINNNTYTIGERTEIGQVSELAGNDVGLVVRASDGFLYQQYVDLSDSSANADFAYEYAHPDAGAVDPQLARLSYRKWVRVADDIRILGVASPGVILDLRTLTASLKTRYMQLQSVLYPVVEKISAFSRTHIFYLDSLKEVAKQFTQSAPADEVAIQEGERFVRHLSVWSDIIDSAVTGVRYSINAMTEDIRDVRQQLKTQLLKLRMDMQALAIGLEGLKDMKSEAEKKRVIAILAIVAGVGAIVSSVMNPLFIVAGGPLLAFGVAFLINAKNDIAQLNQGIHSAETEMATASTSMIHIEAIEKTYGKLTMSFEALSGFWGKIFNEANALKTNTGALLTLGATLLDQGQVFNIDATKASTEQVLTGCTLYLDLLNRQGIQVAPDDDGFSGDLTGFGFASRVVSPNTSTLPMAMARPLAYAELQTHYGQHSNNPHAEFQQVAVQCEMLLKSGNITGYIDHLESTVGTIGRATSAMTIALAKKIDDDAAGAGGSEWFTVSKLAASELWVNTKLSSTNGGSAYNTIDGGVFNTSASALTAVKVALGMGLYDPVAGLESIRPAVARLLQDVISAGSVLDEWKQAYPEIPTSSNGLCQEGFLALQKKTQSACARARSVAAVAVNMFSAFRGDVEVAVHDVEVQVAELDVQTKARDLSYREKVKSIKGRNIAVWGLLGAAGVLSAKIKQEADIKAVTTSYNRETKRANKKRKELMDYLTYGINTSNSSLTWLEMAKQVSSNLGKVFNLVGSIQLQALVGAVEYADLMSTEWADVVASAREVLVLLNNSNRTSVALTLSQAGPLAVAVPLEMSATSSRALDESAAHRAVGQVVQMASSNSRLVTAIDSMAGDADRVFKTLEALVSRPSLAQLVGPMGDDDAGAETLLTAILGMRRKYVQMMASEYETVEALRTHALLEGFKIDAVTKGDLSLSSYTKIVQTAFESSRATAMSTNDRYASLKPEVDALMESILVSLNEAQDEIDEAEAALDEAKFDKKRAATMLSFAIIGTLVAAAIVVIMAAAASAAAASATAASATASSATGGLAGALVSTHGALGLSSLTAALAGLTMTVMESINIAQFKDVIKDLRVLIDDKEAALDDLTEASREFTGLVDGVGVVAEELEKMTTTALVVAADLSTFPTGDIQLTEPAVQSIKTSWMDTARSAERWLAVANRQGISPSTTDLEPPVFDEFLSGSDAFGPTASGPGAGSAAADNVPVAEDIASGKISALNYAGDAKGGQPTVVGQSKPLTETNDALERVMNAIKSALITYQGEITKSGQLC